MGARYDGDLETCHGNLGLLTDRSASCCTEHASPSSLMACNDSNKVRVLAFWERLRSSDRDVFQLRADVDIRTSEIPAFDVECTIHGLLVLVNFS